MHTINFLNARVQVSLRRVCTHLLCKLLNENEGADEDVGLADILLKVLEIASIPELLKKVAHHLDAHLLVCGVDVLHSCRQSKGIRKYYYISLRIRIVIA